MLEKEKGKSFWERPEGTTGTIFTAVIMFGIGYLLYHGLPYINVILANLWYTIFSLGGLSILVYVALDPKFRTAIWYLYKQLMKSFTGLIINLDPIKNLEIYIDHLKDSLREMDARIKSLRTQNEKIGDKIKKNAEEMDKELRKAQSAKAQGNTKITALSVNQASRLEESNKRLAELKEKLDKLYNLLFRIRENSDYVLQDTINEVELRKTEYLAIKEGHSALKAGMRILKGDPDKLEIFELSLEALADSVNTKIGEINYYMEISTDVMNTIDIENNVLTSKGFDLLDKLEKNNFLPDSVTKRDKIETKVDTTSKWDTFLK
jgi:phage shock protein A